MLSPNKTTGPNRNRVPEVTLDFWLIKLMAVTMGETAADYLAVNLGLGLTVTSLIMTGVLIVALGLQFAQKRYVPWAYWLAVVLISVVGTLITDNLVDTFGVRLQTTTIAFSVALVATFAVWYASERTLSIHTIFTTRREIFYWLAILFTFSLGTAAGDLVAESFDMGYLTSGLMFGGVIALIALAYYLIHLDAILAFWRGLYPDAPARRLLRRSSVAAGRIWRPRLRHHLHQPDLPGLHRGTRSLHDAEENGRRCRRDPAGAGLRTVRMR
ncbi:putative membrane-anchored protein [Mesorhizobium sp. USDA 4775]